MIYRFGDVAIDDDAFEVCRSGERVQVEPKVLELLVHLVRNADRMVSKEELLEAVWKRRIVSDAALSTAVRTARKLIGDDGSRQRYIRTVHGRGFRFVHPVRTSDCAPGAPASEAGTVPRPPVTRYARSGDVHIAYQVFGSGPVHLVLMPGFVSHIDNFWASPPFARWLRGLGEFATVAMFDKRGTGMSDPVAHLPGMDERMDDVRAVMDAAGIERAVVMGVSEGGSLACLFAATHPERCLGLVLYGAFARFSSWIPTPEALDELFAYIRRDWGTGKSLPRFAPSAGDDPDLRDWWGRFERLGATPGNAIALMRMNSRIDVSHVLPTIRVPALVLHRDGDVLVDVAGARELAERIPDAKLVLFPGRDHLITVANDADAILQTIGDFIGSLPGDRVIAGALRNLLVVNLERATARGAEAALPHAVSRAGGRLIRRTGDGCVATFEGPARALTAAVRIVEEMRRNDGCARGGVHTGEVHVTGDRLDGLALKIAEGAARLAPAGTVLATRTVRDLVAGHEVAFRDFGELRLDGLPEPWRLYQVDA